MDEMGMSDSQLSRILGRDPSYINQYFRRGSPAVFDERTRQAVAQALALDAAVLLPNAEPTLVHVSIAAAERHTSLVRSGRHIPAFVEGEPLEHAQIPEWVERPSFVSLAGQSFALHITKDHGRLRPGDTAFITGGRPPRAGDLAAIVAIDQRHLAAIGTVLDIGPGQARVDVDGQTAKFDRSQFQVLKIAGAHYA
jgi:phage repressor protein C with HTH and peptisase S24 domain